MIKRVLSFVLSLAMVLSMLPQTAWATEVEILDETPVEVIGAEESGEESAEGYSGTCGTNAVWELSNDGTLTISGTGPVEYGGEWYGLEIRRAIVESGITALDTDAFWDCNQLTSVTLPETVTSISNFTFGHCTALTDVTLAEGLVTIGEGAFYNCSALTEITIPNSVTAIGTEAFGCCLGLESITIPAGVTAMGQRAFIYSSLREITFLGNAPAIAEDAFANCVLTAYCPGENETWTEEVKLSYGAAEIHWYIEGETADLEWEITADNTLIISGNGPMRDYGAGDAPWYQYASQIQKIVVEPGVTTVGESAFFSMGATSVVLPEGVISIGKNAFTYCNRLADITLPSTLTTIAAEAFTYCDRLESITIPAGVTSIGEKVFYYCTAIRKITFLGDAPTIGEKAFFKFYGDLLEIYYPAGNASWTDAVIGNYGSVITIWIPNGEEPNGIIARGTCGEAARWKLTDDGTLTVSGTGTVTEGYFHLGQRDGVTIKRLVVEQGITTIDRIAFNGLHSMTEVSLPEGLKTIHERAFVGCYGLTAITIPEGVTTIANGVFESCDGLRSVTLPTTLTCIGEGAFRTCGQLPSITIPENVTEIGINAFAYCANLKTVTFEGPAPVIGENAFCEVKADVYYPADAQGWTAEVRQNYGGKLTWVSYGTVASGTCGQNASWELDTEGVLTISGTGPMKDYTYGRKPWNWLEKEILTVVIEPGITSIGANTFTCCENLSKVTIPEGIVSIGDYAFLECRSLTAITLPESLVSIGGDAFSHCENLVEINIPEGVVSIGDYAFWCCRIMPEINIPDGLTAIGKYSFGCCEKLTEFIIPESVTSIDQCAFWNCKGIRSITIPKSVTFIGACAFQDCTALKTITFQGPAPVFEEAVFGGFYGAGVRATAYYPICEQSWTADVRQNYGGAIKWVPYGPVASGTCGDNAAWELTMEGVLTISGTGPMTEFAFDQKPAWYSYRLQIKSVIVEQGITSIGAYAFRDHAGLGKVTLPEGITSIGEDAFAGCKALKEINLPTTLTTMGRQAFGGCTVLPSVVIPEGVTQIPDYAFYCCYALRSVVIPESVTTIGERAFSDCKSLAALKLPAGITSIGEEAFNYCASLTGTVVLPGNLTSLSAGIFQDCDRLTSIVIPEGVTSIGDYAFHHSDALKTVTLPSTLTSIGEHAFQHNVITAITIPENVTEIGDYAFAYCEKLKTITFEGNAPVTGENAFSEVNATVNYIVTKLGWGLDEMPNYGGKLTWVGQYPPMQIHDAQGTDVSGQTLDVDMHAEDTLVLNHYFGIEGFAPRISWKSSDDAVATVRDGTVTFHSIGTVTITAFVDGENCSQSVKLNVYYLDKATRLTASAEVPAEGLQSTLTTRMVVYGANGVILDPVNLTYSVPEDQQDIATVDENGIITAGFRPGTANVTAAIAGDPLNRKVTVRVKVIPTQIRNLELIPQGTAIADWSADDGNCTIYVDVEALQGEELPVLNITVNAWDVLGNERPLNSGEIKWTTTDSKVTSLKTSADGSVAVTIRADGACVLQAVSNDLAKAQATATIYVRDYAPRLENSKLTLNTNTESGVNTGLVESYGAAVTEVAVFEYSNALRDYEQVPSARFEAAYESGTLTITHLESVKNGTVKLLLKAACDNGRTYEYPISLKIANSLPSMTVKQLEKFNLFYKDSTARFQITFKGAVPAGAELDFGENPYFESSFDSATGILTVSYSQEFLSGELTGKPVTKATLQVLCEGYQIPVQKSVTLSTEKKAPKLMLTSSSSVINTALNSQPVTEFGVVNTLTGLPVTIRAEQVTAPFADVFCTEDCVSLTLKTYDDGTVNKGGTATVYAQEDNWTEAVKLTHKVTIKTALPTLKLSTKTVKLSTIFADETAEVLLSLDQNNLTIGSFEVTSTATKAATRMEAEKILLDLLDDAIRVSLDPDNLPKNGNYEFRVIAKLEDGTVLKEQKFKVTVEAKVPTVRLKTTTLKLNRQLNTNGYLAMSETALTVSGVTYGYEVSDMIWKTPNEDIQVTFDRETGTVRAILLNPETTVSSFTVMLYPELIHPETGDVVELEKSVKLTVRISSDKPAVSVSAKGKLDLIVPGSAITYTITRMSNISGKADAVRLEGDGAEFFDVVLSGDGNRAILTLKPGAVCDKGKSYRLQLIFRIYGQDVAANITVRTEQSALKLAVTGALNLYQSNSRLNCRMTVSAPAGAKIETIVLNEKSAPQFLAALGDQTLIWTQQEDGTILVRFNIQNSAQLTGGKSYTVYLDVVPEGNAPNVKPTQVRLSIKVSK